MHMIAKMRTLHGCDYGLR